MASLSRLFANTSGATALTVALALPVLVGAVGMGVETGLWYVLRRQAATAADAGAVAGAMARFTTGAATVAVAARRDVERNGFVSDERTTVDIRTPPQMGAYAGDTGAVEVAVSLRWPMLFGSLLHAGDALIAVRAVAAAEISGEACVLALDAQADRAINSSGSTIADLAGCTLAANSVSAEAIRASGTSSMVAHQLWTAGGFAVGGSASIQSSEPAQTYAWPIPDPYEQLTTVVPPGCDSNGASYSGTTITISPGVYCGGITFGSQSIVTLLPGTYWIDGGNLRVNSQAVIRCACDQPGDGVTIVLTSSGSPADIGTVTINGGASVDLKAPAGDSGDFRGMLFVQDRRAPEDGINKFNGGSSMNLTGAIYFPVQGVEWSGNNSTASSACTQIVSRTVTFIGNSRIDDGGCAEAGVEPIQLTLVRLVE